MFTDKDFHICGKNPKGIEICVYLCPILPRKLATSDAPPAEREASGSPPEGGDGFGKAPLGLSNRHHQILIPFVSFQSFLGLECIYVWFLHPNQPY